MVDMELLYQTHFKEELVAKSIRSRLSSFSSFKVHHSCWEFPHSKHFFPSVVHLQLLTEAEHKDLDISAQHGSTLTSHICTRTSCGVDRGTVKTSVEFDFSLCLILLIPLLFHRYSFQLSIVNPSSASAFRESTYDKDPIIRYL